MPIISTEDILQSAPRRESTSADWISFHERLLKEFRVPLDFSKSARTSANALFLAAWQKNGSNSANDTELRAYMKGQKVAIEPDIYDQLYGAVTDPFGIVSSYSSGMKYASWVIGITVILFIGIALLLLYNIAKNPIGSANAASSFFNPRIQITPPSPPSE